ncbi:MAG TPA: ABC transporter permease, partial [Blastococcus sp.]
MTGPRNPGSGALVRLVAAREISTRVRDRSFIISSAVIMLLIVGSIALQVALNSGGDEVRIGVVGDRTALQPALEAQGDAVGTDVTVAGLDDEAAARTAVD